MERVQADTPDLHLNSFVTVVDATKAKVYMKNFGEFFNNQVEHACAIVLSRTQKLDEAKLNGAVHLLREKNPRRPFSPPPGTSSPASRSWRPWRAATPWPRS